MRRRQLGREFKIEAVHLIKDRGASVAQASRDMDVHENQLRKWVKLFSADPAQAFPGHGHMKPEQREIEKLRREVAKLKAEPDILKGRGLLREGPDRRFTGVLRHSGLLMGARSGPMGVLWLCVTGILGPRLSLVCTLPRRGFCGSRSSKTGNFASNFNSLGLVMRPTRRGSTGASNGTDAGTQQRVAVVFINCGKLRLPHRTATPRRLQALDGWTRASLNLTQWLSFRTRRSTAPSPLWRTRHAGPCWRGWSRRTGFPSASWRSLFRSRCRR